MTRPAHPDLAAALAALPVFPELRGRRVRLRGPRADDAPALFALYSDPAVMRYWSRPPMSASSEAEGLVAEILDACAQRTMLNWMVTQRDDDAVIGTCTLFRFDPRHRRAEIGYSLRQDRWGRGYAREAVTLSLDWAFGTLGLHRIEAGIDPRNDGSRALLQRLGFVSEGVLRERTEIFGLLAQDWCKRSVRSL